MELLRINDKKLKILLTKEDMTAYSLTAETLDYNNTETKRAFWSILDEAKHKTGFDAAKDKIYVQIYPSRGGGCELYVTKLTDGKHASARLMTEKPPAEKLLFRFETLGDLLAACACLAECGFAEDSSAYAETHTCYLALEKAWEEEEKKTLRQPTSADLVAEFGKRLSPTYEAFLSEHAECICPHNAVERLAALYTPHS